MDKIFYENKMHIQTLRKVDTDPLLLSLRKELKKSSYAETCQRFDKKRIISRKRKSWHATVDPISIYVHVSQKHGPCH